jgi:hypothetical protein
VEGAGQAPADTSPAVEGGPEPRSGEFEITDAPRTAELETIPASGETAPADRPAVS